MSAKSWFWAVTVGGFLCLATGCDEGAAPPKAPVQASTTKPAPVKPVQEPEEAAEEPAEEGIAYDPAEIRDPFTPLAFIRKPVAQDEPLTPLQQFELDQFRLVGLLVGKGEPRAMVAAPDGKTYILSRGTKIGKNFGKVVAINPEGILIKEQYYDFSGQVMESEQRIQLPKKEGER